MGEVGEVVEVGEVGEAKRGSPHGDDQRNVVALVEEAHFAAQIVVAELLTVISGQHDHGAVSLPAGFDGGEHTFQIVVTLSDQAVLPQVQAQAWPQIQTVIAHSCSRDYPQGLQL